ncbi:LysR family transcriptional regulator [Paraburkholderia sediminicola]|uniref:LysR family transcriptional regulator n=1 Tax=Paraburkholderia sediminicola TaxID=458836 RepID=UPI0038BC1197
MTIMNEMDNFDLNLLKVFDALWRHGHLGRAAEELDLSQPAISHSLKRMRKQMNDELFLKMRTGMQPSPRAVQLAPVVQAVLANVREHVLTAPIFDPAQACRTFTIVMSDVGEMAFLPRLLARIMREAPLVDIQTISPSHRDLMSLLERSKVDLLMGYFPDLRGSDIFQQRLFNHGFVCLARKGHPVVNGEITHKEFKELSHVVVQTEGRSWEIVEQYLQSNGVERRELLKLPHFLSIPMVIAMTDLIVTVPLPVGEVFARIAGVQVLTPPFPIPSFDLKLHWHRCQHSDPGNRWLRSVALELFGAT